MNRKIAVDTYEIKIYIGSKVGYNGPDQSTYDMQMRCREYCDEVGFAVTVTQTNFVYTGGEESGVIIGIINYPRFPKTPEELDEHAFTLANMLMKEFKQYRCSVVTSDYTYLLENEELVGNEGDRS